MNVRRIFIYVGSYIITLLVLWLLLFMSVLIPNDSIRTQMEKSALTFKNKEEFEFTDGNRYNAVEDNYADAILLNVVWNMGKGHPVIGTLDTKYYDGNAYGEGVGLFLSVTEDVPANTDYTRYWHGSAAVIRPLLLLTDIDCIELVGFVTVVVLLIMVTVILIKKKAAFAAVGLNVSMAGIQFWNIRLSLEYIPMFVLMLLISLAALLTEKKSNSSLGIIAIISGTATAFFDFLTTETITIIVPVILVCMVRAKDGRLGDFRSNIKLLVIVLLCWGVAYIMTFIAKWGIASLVTGENKFVSALTSAGNRISMEENNVSAVEMFLKAIPANLSTMFGGTQRVQFGRVGIGISVVVLIAGSVWYLFRDKRDSRTITVILLLLGLIPYIRYMILSNHSYLHEFFTYRAQCISILALWGLIYFNIKLPLCRNKKTKGRRHTR